MGDGAGLLQRSQCYRLCMEPRAWEMGLPHLPVLQGGPAKLARGSDRNVPDASACIVQADASHLNCYSGHSVTDFARSLGYGRCPAGRPHKTRQWLRSRVPDASVCIVQTVTSQLNCYSDHNVTDFAWCLGHGRWGCPASQSCRAAPQDPPVAPVAMSRTLRLVHGRFGLYCRLSTHSALSLSLFLQFF